jgi:hypothetical protein
MTHPENAHMQDTEARLFALARYCQIPLRRLDGEPLSEVAHRLVLDIQDRKSILDRCRDEIATLDFDDGGQA